MICLTCLLLDYHYLLESMVYLSCIGVRRAGVLVHHLRSEQDRTELLLQHLQLGIVHLRLLEHRFEQMVVHGANLLLNLLLLLLLLLDHHTGIHHLGGLLLLGRHDELQVVAVLWHHISLGPHTLVRFFFCLNFAFSLYLILLL